MLRNTLISALALAVTSCGGHSRFALRPPLLRDVEQPLAEAPAEDEETDIANAADVIVLRPTSRTFLFEQGSEARNVNSLDEVPDSSWFTNRSVAPAELDLGPCGESAEPVPPFTIRSTKVGGTAPGFVVEDATGQRYVLKLDQLPRTQPEINTAADAIVSRLYWAVGFNAPCNSVVFVRPSDLRVGEGATERRARGERRPFSARRLVEILAPVPRRPDGTLRIGASRFIDGEPVGTWRTEGTRADDPNDLVPHEDRRELRGERFLAAWVNHWDSRGPNSYDAFVEVPGGGLVVHYFLDFADSLGATAGRTQWAEPRMGFTTVSNAPAIAVDILSLGFVRRPWDEVRVDPRYPNLGFLDVEHFEPLGYSPQTPLVRWSRAQPADLAWMARRIAMLEQAHVIAAVRHGKLSDRAEEARLVEILMGRRRRILEQSFARTSPLTAPELAGARTFCATDLGVATGISRAVSYALAFRAGASFERTMPAELQRSPGGRVCATLPHFAPSSAGDDDAARYARLDVIRTEGATQTLLRAHFYDLGPERGYALVGIERP